MTGNSLFVGVFILSLSTILGSSCQHRDASSALEQAGGTVDASTLNKKHMFGYQGWFRTPADGANKGWNHWFNKDPKAGGHPTFDLWPDTREYAETDLAPSGYFYQNGAPAPLFSSFRPGVVDVHFRWLQENGLDGVFLQRFTSTLLKTSDDRVRNQVLQNVRAAAEAHGRVFAVMYDLSGTPAASILDVVTSDWDHLQKSLKITGSSRYLHEKGKPVVAVWGLGFADRDISPALAQQVLDALHARGLYVMGGVPTGWQSMKDDADSRADWQGVYRSLDLISPWSVGRYNNEAGADRFRKSYLEGDIAATKAAGIAYMPVIFPGFSWSHLKPGSGLNAIPRLGGQFYWRQAFNALDAGATMLYTAMFDEVDEGTAMFKVAATQKECPKDERFLSLDADGYALPSDWYLQLAGKATQMLHGSIPLSSRLPLELPARKQ